MFDDAAVRDRLDGFRKLLAMNAPTAKARAPKDGPNLEIADYIAKKLRTLMRNDDLQAMLELAKTQSYSAFLRTYHGHNPASLEERDRFERELAQLGVAAGYRLDIYKNDRSGLYLLRLK